jgi:AsmA protein
MPVWIRRLGIALAVLLLIAFAAAAWLISTFDPNKYKGVAVEWMKTHRNRSLAIDGPIELSVFPRLQVRLSRVSLSEAGHSDEFAGIDDAALSVALLPLLRGALNIDRVETHGVRLTLTADANGKRNTDDLTASAAAEPNAGGGAGSSTAKAPLSFDVSGVALTDLRARVKDEKAGIDGEVLLKELTSGRIANQIETPIKLVMQLGLKAPALKGELTGSAKVTPDVPTGSVRFKDMDFNYKGDAPGASAIDATLKGALAWDGAKAALEMQALALKLTANAAGVKFADTTLAIDRFAFDPTRKAFAIEQLKLRVKGTRGGQPLEMELDWPELNVAGEALKGSALAGKLSLGGTTLPLAASFRSGAPSGSFDEVRVPAFEAQLTSDTAARKLLATLRSDLVLRPAKRALALQAMALELNAQGGELPPLKLKLRGSTTASAQTAQWAFTGDVNANAFSTEGTAGFGGTLPDVKAQARFDMLDLNTLLPAAKAAPSGAAPAAPAAGDTPVDLSALRRVNGSFGLRAGRFVLRQYKAADLKLDATLESGLLRVPAMQAKIWGGAVDATALADARASRVAVKATASGVNVNALLKDVAAKDILEGTGRVVADIDTGGHSVGEMRSRLHGTAALQLRDGAIKGLNLAKSLRQAKAALTMKQDATQKASQVEKTDFSELSASFDIDAGVARSKDLDMKSPFLRLGGDGLVDAGKSRIDYTARATVAATSKGQDGADLAALKGLTVPVRLTGPLDAIEWKVQWSAVAGDLVKARLEDKLKERLGLKPADAAGSAPATAASAPSVKEQAKDALKNKLKGLLK